jgi:hypothetical protein
MSTVLSWWWMKVEAFAWWRKITLRRHKGELRALRTARAFPLLAIFPIGRTVGFWWFALCAAFVLPPYVLGLVLTGSAIPLAQGLGSAVLILVQVFAFVALVFVAPWFFRWYFISAGLMLGRAAMADRKEAQLLMAIAAHDR